MSPSRLMAIMDPLINTGFLWRCLAAYAGIKSDDEPPHDELSAATIATDNLPEKRRKTDSVDSSSNQIPSNEEQTLPHSEQMSEDTYYARLSI